MGDAAWVSTLKVADLKEELKSRGLPCSGLKAALAERLLSALNKVDGKDISPAVVEDDKPGDSPQSQAKQDGVEEGDAAVTTNPPKARVGALAEVAGKAKALAEQAPDQPQDDENTPAAVDSQAATEPADKPQNLVQGVATEPGPTAPSGAANAADKTEAETVEPKEEPPAIAYDGEEPAATQLAAALTQDGGAAASPATQAGPEPPTAEAEPTSAPAAVAAEPVAEPAEEPAAAAGDEAAAPVEAPVQREGTPKVAAQPLDGEAEEVEVDYEAEEPEAPAPAPAAETPAPAPSRKDGPSRKREREGGAAKPEARPEKAGRTAQDTAPAGKVPRSKPAPSKSKEGRSNKDDKAPAKDAKPAKPAKPNASARKADRKEPERARERDRDADKDRSKANDTGGRSERERERKRKHSPIPTFKPKARRGAEELPAEAPASAKAGVTRERPSTENGQPAALEGRGSVFDRLTTGKEEARDSAPAPAHRGDKTRALRIDGFIRPFTEVAARKMLSQTGEVESMWMPKIRNVAYVVYKTVEEAEATRQATWGLTWPPENKCSLRPRFVSVEEAEDMINGQGNSQAKRAAATAATPDGGKPESTARPNGQAADVRSAPLDDRKGSVKDAATAEPSGAPAAKMAPAQPEAADPVMSLDDLFRKTATKPALYWLPNSEEAIAAKVEKEAAVPPLPGPPKAPGPHR